MKTLVIGSVLAALIVFGLASVEPRSDTQVSKDDLGELARYDGDWIINGDRRSLRVVTHRQSNLIQTFAAEYRENFGCPFTQYCSMKMTFDPATKRYRAKVKWGGRTNVEHFQEPWLPHDLVGTWNGETKTMTWTNNADVDHTLKRLEITTQFPDTDKQRIAIFEIDGERRVQQLAGAVFERLQ